MIFLQIPHFYQTSLSHSLANQICHFENNHWNIYGPTNACDKKKHNFLSYLLVIKNLYNWFV